MLVLSCKIDEGIMIGDNIRVVVIDVINGKVKLGIQADKSIPVHRDKIYQDIKNGKPNVET
jgi:carbon storage regulator